MINNVKIGIKISIDNINLLSEIYANQGIIDFIEVILNPKFELQDIYVIKKLKLPYAIHLPNSNNGIDFGDYKRNDENKEFINRINRYKNELNSLKPICYIIHPESGDIEFSIMNIKKLKIKPLALENMPKIGIRGEKLLGYDLNSLNLYFNRINYLEFCFDINHAIKAAISMKKDYISFIKEFLGFKKPILFHISGGNLSIETDEHLSLEEGQYNLSEIKKILFNYDCNINLTFETPQNYERKISDDLKNMELFQKTDY